MTFRNVRRCAVGLLGLGLFVCASPAPAEDMTGKGSLGFSLGAMRFTGGEDLTDGVGIRPIMRLSFKYTWDPRLVSVLEAGFGWNAYGEGGGFQGPDSVGTVAVVRPVTLGMDYVLSSGGSVMPRVGGGLGFYNLSIRSGRDRVSSDPVTDQRRRTTGLGFYGKVGSDFVLKPAFVLNTDLLWHQTLTGDAERYPRGFLDSNASFAEIRVGLNYYFTIHSTGPSPMAPDEDSDEE